LPHPLVQLGGQLAGQIVHFVDAGADRGDLQRIDDPVSVVLGLGEFGQLLLKRCQNLTLFVPIAESLVVFDFGGELFAVTTQRFFDRHVFAAKLVAKHSTIEFMIGVEALNECD
jgi:hypothetical protein